MSKRSEKSDVDLDSILYEEYSPEETLAICSKEEIGLLTISIGKIVTNAISSGIRIIVDVEPIHYESVLALLSTLTACLSVWKSAIPIKNTETGEYYTFNFSMFTFSRPGKNEISVVFVGEKKKEDEILRDLEVVLSSSRIVYFMVVPKRPSITFASAIYLSNAILNLARDTFNALDKDKANYVGRVPYDVLFLMPTEHVKKIAETLTPPPPSYSNYLNKKPRRLEDIVLPEEFKELLKQYITVVRMRSKGSLALIGLPRSGRKTIAASIATELGLPAFWVSVANVLSKYVGESEEKFRSFFESLRARGGLAVVDNVDSLFKKSGHEETSSNLRSILFQEMARDDNNFVVVFTFNEDVPGEALDSPLLGELKLVIPPPTREERRRLAKMFLWEIVEQFKKLEPVIAKYGRDQFEKMYAESFVNPTAGMTSGEIYQVMESVLIPAFTEMSESGKLIDITRNVLKVTRRDLAARRAKLRMINQLAISLGQIAIAQQVKQLYEEVMTIDKREEAEKYKIM